MKIVYRNRVSETITRDTLVGYKLVGVRLDSVIIESQEELNTLLTPQGIEWARRNLNFKPISYVAKESNWGSDWVDDGV